MTKRRPSLGITTEGRLTIAVGDHTMTVSAASRAWLVIHPQRGFLRGFDNGDCAAAFAREHHAAVVVAHVAADYTTTGPTPDGH